MATAAQLRRALLLLSLCVLPARAAQAASIDVYCCDPNTPIGTISFSNYGMVAGYIDTSTDPATKVQHAGQPTVDDTYIGASFDATFDFTGCPPGMTLRPGTMFQWVQIVVTNDPLGAGSPRGTAPTTGYVDPWSANTPSGYEDYKPFYWTDAELADPDIGGNPAATGTLKFSDTSTRGIGDNTATEEDVIRWTAYLNLVCTWDNKVHSLGYFTWGWTYDQEPGATNPTQLNPDPATWTAGPSPNLNILANADEFGAGSVAAKNGTGAWSTTNECCCVPLPSSVMGGMLLVGLMAYGRRRASLLPAA